MTAGIAGLVVCAGVGELVPAAPPFAPVAVSPARAVVGAVGGTGFDTAGAGPTATEGGAGTGLIGSAADGAAGFALGRVPAATGERPGTGLAGAGASGLATEAESPVAAGGAGGRLLADRSLAGRTGFWPGSSGRGVARLKIGLCSDCSARVSVAMVGATTVRSADGGSCGAAGCGAGAAGCGAGLRSPRAAIEDRSISSALGAEAGTGAGVGVAWLAPVAGATVSPAAVLGFAKASPNAGSERKASTMASMVSVSFTGEPSGC